MANANDFGDIAGLPDEMKKALTTTFDALANWREEVENANKRYLGKVLDQFAKTSRMMGWSDEVISANREATRNVAQMQIKAIDEIMETWKQQLATTKGPTGEPRLIGYHLMQKPEAFAQNFQAFGPMAPWMLWLEAAEAWQKTWSSAWVQQETDRSRNAPHRERH
jgi:hypothetical protein